MQVELGFIVETYAVLFLLAQNSSAVLLLIRGTSNLSYRHVFYDKKSGSNLYKSLKESYHVLVLLYLPTDSWLAKLC